ncbi:MAG TPA: 50S ribosomal protein L11 methyltransferase [Longimicrobiales bacterium]|nr:50S ribosomal protein L11 methyltransferase [Longimicrobiales bacterium]
MPARWLVLSVRVPSEEQADLLTEGLFALGGTAVEEEGDLLTTYIAEPADVDGFLTTAADRLAGIAGAEPEMLWRWQEDEDWSRRWKEGLEPHRVGRGIMVTQPWNSVEGEGDDIVITIDPATAFGTGEHATTRGALALLESAVRDGDRVLDVGAGSAILAIAAVRLGADSVLAVEADPDAMGNARENVERNGVTERVDLVNARVDEVWLEDHRGAYDVVAANVLSGILVPLLPGLAGALAPGGALILGGILESEAPMVLDAARGAGLTAERELVEGEWWTCLLRAS